ncbi:MAG: hypothetical protein AAGD22_14955 [Verrucomicrobiota bacterium]
MKGVKVMATCVLGVITYYTARTVLVVPKFEDVYRDLLPGRPLPGMTEFVVSAKTPLFCFVVLIPVVVAIYGFRSRVPERAFAVFGASFVALVVINHYLVSALLGPMQMIISGLSAP